jgi:hypothetical protein
LLFDQASVAGERKLAHTPTGGEKNEKEKRDTETRLKKKKKVVDPGNLGQLTI